MTVEESESRVINFNEQRKPQSEGYKAVAEAYGRLQGISRQQGLPAEHRIRDFIEGVSADPTITREDVIEFIADQAVIADFGRRIICSGSVD